MRSSVFTKNGYRELADREKRVTYSDKACQRNFVVKRNPCDMSFFGGSRVSDAKRVAIYSDDV